MSKYYSFNDGVNQEVISLIKRRVAPGTPVTSKDLKIAYRIVRTNAIADTLLFKDKFITTSWRP